MPKTTLLFVCAINNAFKNKGTEQHLRRTDYLFIYYYRSRRNENRSSFVHIMADSCLMSKNLLLVATTLGATQLHREIGDFGTYLRVQET